jgi:hypothetical protein
MLHAEPGGGSPRSEVRATSRKSSNMPARSSATLRLGPSRVDATHRRTGQSNRPETTNNARALCPVFRGIEESLGCNSHPFVVIKHDHARKQLSGREGPHFDC